MNRRSILKGLALSPLALLFTPSFREALAGEGQALPGNGGEVTPETVEAYIESELQRRVKEQGDVPSQVEVRSYDNGSGRILKEDVSPQVVRQILEGYLPTERGRALYLSAMLTPARAQLEFYRNSPETSKPSLGEVRSKYEPYLRFIPKTERHTENYRKLSHLVQEMRSLQHKAQV